MKKKLFTLLTLLCLCVTGAWADDVIFSMTSVKNGTTSVSAGEDLSITATYNTGSSAKVYNPTTGAKEMVSGTQINLKGSSSVYYVASFTVALQEGDIITSSNTAANTFYVAKNGGSKIAANFPYAIPENSPLIGETNLYVYKTGTSGTQATFTSFTITRPTGTQVPQISLSGNTVTLTCVTSGATIYYTTDGSAPSTTSNHYSEPFVLDNSCTIRAFAKKGDDVSGETTKDCYINHSSADKFLTILKFNGGAVDGEDANLWTSTDGKYSLRDNNNPQTSKYTTLEAGNDAFKLSHVDGYTLYVPSDVKITKIAFIGKSLYEGYTGTVRVTDFNSNNAKSFITYATGGEKYLSTIEFAPDAALDYGTSVAFNPGGCESAAYIEIYGEERKGPADPIVVGGDPIIWDFSSSEAQEAAGTITVNISNELTATDGTSKITYVAGNDSYEASSKGYYIKTGGGSGSTRYFVLKISSNGSLGITSTGNNGEYVIKKAANSSTNYSSATNLTTITTTKNGEEVQGDIVYDKDKPYLIIGFAAKKYTQKITWTPSSDDIELTTTDNMAGWRAFNPDGQGYTLDANTKAFIVTATPSDNKVTLVTLAEGNQDIPGNTPVILYTTSTADSHKMTLTAKAGVDDYTGTNLLKVTTAAQDLSAGKCRLGYGASGVGFYKYAVASAPAGIIYLDAAPVQEGKGYTFVFEGETTGISNLNVNDNENIDANAPMYNLAGQRVNKSYKGVVIVNGKKMLNK